MLRVERGKRKGFVSETIPLRSHIAHYNGPQMALLIGIPRHSTPFPRILLFTGDSGFPSPLNNNSSRTRRSSPRLMYGAVAAKMIIFHMAAGLNADLKRPRGIFDLICRWLLGYGVHDQTFM